MAQAKRENSGLVVKVDGRRGRMALFVHGHRVPAFSIQTESSHMQQGVLMISIPLAAVVFENVENDPVKETPLDAN